MKLLDVLNNIQRCTEASFSIKLIEADFAPVREEIEHLYLHRACHAAVKNCAPWIYALEGSLQSAVIETLTRFVEVTLRKSCSLPLPKAIDFVHELRHYPINITLPDFEHLLGLWEGTYWLQRDLEGMAHYVNGFFHHGRMLCHILSREDWETAQKEGVYAPSSLNTEGFIHCSTAAQVLQTANTFYSAQEDLMLLWIAENSVSAEIRFEDLSDEGTRFPHIYGTLNLDAVVDQQPFSKGEDGEFVLPGYKKA
jgi:uncharacterized protein (DUF952 family)